VKRQGSGGNIVAAICSFFVPGLGQLFQGRFFSALSRARWRHVDEAIAHAAKSQERSTIPQRVEPFGKRVPSVGRSFGH
jgi:hypothetical protein